MSAPLGNQYAKGHGEGRPCEYNSSFVDVVYKFIEKCIAEPYRLPTREGLCNTIRVKRSDGTIKKGVRITTIACWGKDNHDFSIALEYLDRFQKDELITRGLNNDANSTIAKLILSANHGMHDKTEVDNTHRLTKIPQITIGNKEVKFDVD